MKESVTQKLRAVQLSKLPVDSGFCDKWEFDTSKIPIAKSGETENVLRKCGASGGVT